MKKALHAVKAGEMGWFAAATIFDVPRTSLIYRGAMLMIEGPKYSESKWSERDLVTQFKMMESRLFDFSYTEARLFAYQFAAKNSVEHRLGAQKNAASIGWLRGFITRYPNVSISPKRNATTAAQVLLNTGPVEQFLKTLQELVKKENITTQDIWTVAESSLSNMKLDRKASTSEHQERISTIVCCMNSAGSFIPPTLIFKQNNCPPQFVNGAPPGTLGLSQECGIMTSELFIHWFQHFTKWTLPTPKRKVLLLLDAQTRHKHFDVINYAHSNNIIMLSFPPNSTRQLQPLNFIFFLSLQSCYDKEMMMWTRQYPACIMGSYEVAKLFGIAYKKTTRELALGGFLKTGIYKGVSFKDTIGDTESTKRLAALQKLPQLELPARKTITNVLPNAPWNKEIEFTPAWNAKQMKFLDYVLMVWVNRYRAGDPTTVIPDSMINAKAIEASQILGLRFFFGRLRVISFKNKLRKQDYGHPPHLDLGNPSMNIKDIINEKYESFRIDDTGIFCLGTPPCKFPKNHWNLEVFYSDEWYAKQRKFLDHVLLIWVNQCRGGNPESGILDWLIKENARKVSDIFNMKNFEPDLWIKEFKEKLRHEDVRNPPLLFRANLVKNIMDILYQEWTLFRGDDTDVLWDGKYLQKPACDQAFSGLKIPVKHLGSDGKSNDSNGKAFSSCDENIANRLKDEPVEQLICDKESIDSYGEALDCLMVIKSYALSEGNTEALNLINELDDFLANEN